jgi:hypothetical protein
VLKLREEQATEKLNRALLAGWQAPDLLGIGVIVCDASRRLLIANQTALDVLHAQDGLGLSSDGRLCESDEGAHLVTNLLRCCATEPHSTQRPANGCLSVNVPRKSGKTPLFLLARPFRPPATEGPASMTLIILVSAPLATEENRIGSLLRLVGCEDSVGNRVYREGLQ